MQQKKKKQYIVGIDEVGRGALAGPVVVAAVAAPHTTQLPRLKNAPPLRDSKKLQPHHRIAWFKLIKAHPHFYYTIARTYPCTIDRVNISRAANRAATRALVRLFRLVKQSTMRGIFLDGGLYLAPDANSRSKNIKVKTLIKGDEKINVIKLASIIAKVTRDRSMCVFAERYPEYKFNVHKGYGTKLHRRALRKHGLCEIHRRSFCKNFLPK